MAANHQPHDCLLNHLLRRTSKKTSKQHVTGLCEGNSPVAGEFPAQRASNAENVSFDDVIMEQHKVMLCSNPYSNNGRYKHAISYLNRPCFKPIPACWNLSTVYVSCNYVINDQYIHAMTPAVHSQVNDCDFRCGPQWRNMQEKSSRGTLFLFRETNRPHIMSSGGPFAK